MNILVIILSVHLLCGLFSFFLLHLRQQIVEETVNTLGYAKDLFECYGYEDRYMMLLPIAAELGVVVLLYQFLFLSSDIYINNSFGSYNLRQVIVPKVDNKMKKVRFSFLIILATLGIHTSLFFL